MGNSFTGELGKVEWEGDNEEFVLHSYSWNFTENAGIVDTTEFQPESGFRTFLGGLKSGTGSVSCYIDDTTAVPENNRTVTAMTLTAGGPLDGSKTVSYVFDAFVTGLTFNSAVSDQAASLTINFQISGAVTRVMTTS